MFSKMLTKKFTSNCSEQIERLRAVLRNCDAVLIGAGAGLSTSAGFTYNGDRFKKYFHDFEKKYGFHDMYSGGFYLFPTEEERWAYWSRNIWINRYMDAPKTVYYDLLQLMKSKDYFVLTTNVDHQFQKAGFDKQRLFYTQGDYGLFQCSEPCCQKTYDNEESVRQMVEQQRDMRVPNELVPHCPACGRSMAMNLRCDDTFVEDVGWHQAAERYENFLCMHDRQKIVFMELGVGYNTPGIIKYPFWQMITKNCNAIYVCINKGQAVMLQGIERQSICINEDIGKVLQNLLN